MLLFFNRTVENPKTYQKPSKTYFLDHHLTAFLPGDWFLSAAQAQGRVAIAGDVVGERWRMLKDQYAKDMVYGKKPCFYRGCSKSMFNLRFLDLKKRLIRMKIIGKTISETSYTTSSCLSKPPKDRLVEGTTVKAYRWVGLPRVSDVRVWRG